MTITEITTEQVAEKTTRVAFYCRVSTNSDDQIHSLATQIKYYTDFLKKHADYVLVDFYVDEGLTGTSLKRRDDMNRMIEDCRKGKIDHVVVKSVSRFARNVQELLEILRLFKSIGVTVYFEEQGIDTKKLNSEMLITFPGLAAQQESTVISENMRWSYSKRMAAGEFNCCTPAYGFQMVDGELQIKEEEALVVRKIFDMFLRGCGKQAIANELNQLEQDSGTASKEWSRTAVDYILNNERYMGDAVLQKRFTTESLPYRRVPNKGEKPIYYVENANIGIISKETFDAAKELQKKRGGKRFFKQQSVALTQMLFCPDCGRAFRRNLNKNDNTWVCSARSALESKCQMRRVKEEAVYDAFIMLMYKLKDKRKELLGTLIKQLIKLEECGTNCNNKIKTIDMSIAQLSAQNHTIAKLHNIGVLNSAEFSAKSAEINNKLTELRAERRKLISEDSNQALLDELNELNDIIKEYQYTPQFNQELFDKVVEKIIVIDNGTLQFNLMGGIKLAEKISERRRCQSA